MYKCTHLNLLISGANGSTLSFDLTSPWLFHFSWSWLIKTVRLFFPTKFPTPKIYLLDLPLHRKYKIQEINTGKSKELSEDLGRIIVDLHKLGRYLWAISKKVGRFPDQILKQMCISISYLDVSGQLASQIIGWKRFYSQTRQRFSYLTGQEVCLEE